MPRHVSRSLAAWTGALLVLLAAHDLSHALDDGLETKLGQLALVAVPQWLAIAAVTAVIIRADQARATAAAMLLGSAVAVGFVAIHLLPVSTASYWDLHPSAVSWAVAVVPAGVGIVVAALAWSERQRRLAPA